MSRQSPSRDHRPSGHRLTTLGAGGVGKTALLHRFLNDEFIEKHKETVEDLHIRTFNVNGQFIQARIFDTAGNVQFPAMRRLSIGNAQAFLLVYDVTSECSFRMLRGILTEIKELRSEKDLSELPIVIAANKCDSPTGQRAVLPSMVKEFMLNETLDLQAVHLETSAKTGYNVRVVFETLIKLSPLFLGKATKKPASRVASVDFVRSPTSIGVGQWRTPGASPVRAKGWDRRRFSLQTDHRGASIGLLKIPTRDDHLVDAKVTSEPFHDHVSRMGAGMKASGTSEELSELKRDCTSRNRMKLFRRNKTKSHDEYDVPECNVQ